MNNLFKITNILKNLFIKFNFSLVEGRSRSKPGNWNGIRLQGILFYHFQIFLKILKFSIFFNCLFTFFLIK